LISFGSRLWSDSTGTTFDSNRAEPFEYLAKHYVQQLSRTLLRRLQTHPEMNARDMCTAVSEDTEPTDRERTLMEGAGLLPRLKPKQLSMCCSMAL
jgi:transposase InsO family protein